MCFKLFRKHRVYKSSDYVSSYGKVGYQRQGEIIRGLALSQQAMQSNTDEIADAVLRKLRDAGVGMLAG